MKQKSEKKERERKKWRKNDKFEGKKVKKKLGVSISRQINNAKKGVKLHRKKLLIISDKLEKNITEKI